VKIPFFQLHLNSVTQFRDYLWGLSASPIPRIRVILSKIEVEIDIPKVGQEKVDVIDIVYLLHKLAQVIQECFLIVFHDHVKIYPMFSARHERFAIVATKVPSNNEPSRQSSLGLHSRIEVVFQNLHNQRSWIDRLQITPGHLQH
jgi:hypothetical protein